MAAESLPTKPKAQAKKRQRAPLSPTTKQFLIGAALLTLSALLITAIWHVTRIKALQIDTVTVAGGYTIPHQVVEKAVWNELSGAYLKLIPHSFRYTYPASSIAAAVAGVPRMKTATIERSGNTISVSFDEYVPFALWCNTAHEHCLFIDQAGYAFSAAPSLKGGAFVRFIRGSDEPVLRESMFPISFFEGVNHFIENIERDFGLYVTSVATEGDYDVYVDLSNGGRLKLSQARSFDESFANLKTILASEEFSHLETGGFQYIDLRFGDKVFVNEEGIGVGTTTASSTEPDSTDATTTATAAE